MKTPCDGEFSVDFPPAYAYELFKTDCATHIVASTNGSFMVRWVIKSTRLEGRDLFHLLELETGSWTVVSE